MAARRKFVYVIAWGRVELKINFHAYFQSFPKFATRATAKTLKVQVKINPQFYENSMRLRVSNIEGKILKTIEALRKTVSPGVKALTRQQSKQANYLIVS